MDSFNKLCSVFMLRDAVDYRGLFFHTLTFGGLVQLHLLHVFDNTHSGPRRHPPPRDLRHGKECIGQKVSHDKAFRLYARVYPSLLASALASLSFICFTCSIIPIVLVLPVKRSISSSNLRPRTVFRSSAPASSSSCGGPYANNETAFEAESPIQPNKLEPQQLFEHVVKISYHRMPFCLRGLPFFGFMRSPLHIEELGQMP